MMNLPAELRPSRRAFYAAVVGAVFAILTVPAPPFALQSGDFDETLRAATKNIVSTGTHPGIKWTRFPYYVDELEAVYGPRDYSPVWLDGAQLNSQVDPMIAEIALAESQGLDPEDYDAAMLAQTSAAIRRGDVADPEALARFDTALSIAFLRYVSDLHIGRINPNTLQLEFDIEEKKYDLAAVLNQALNQGDMSALIANVQPAIPVYARLKELLPKYRALAADPDWAPLPVVEPAVRPGDPYVGTMALARRLGAVGDLPSGEIPSGDAPQGLAAEDTAAAQAVPLYEGPVVDGVKRFQSRHGLDADGILGPATFRALNTPFSARVRAIELALERLRWLPFLGDEAFIVVNIPSFRLWAFDKGKLGVADLAMNVIVGKSIDKTQTPIFSERIKYIDFAPYWNVPYSITRDELLPKIRRDPGYLDAHDMEIVADFGNDAPAVPATKENIDALARGKTNLRQRPGSQNALGKVKFIFPNAHNVYLHSTPAQQLFSRTKRDFSHGCIRVEKPVDLAVWLLRGDPEWDRASIEAAMDGTRPRRVFLKQPVPVHLFYASVIVDANGVAAFYPDIYEHDERLQRALDKGYPYEP